MASTSQCLASLARLSLTASAKRPTASTIPKFLVPAVATQVACYAKGGGGGGNMNQRKKVVKEKKKYKTYRSYDLSPMQQVSLCDAMRYLRAFEVGQAPASVKYEIAVKVKSQRSAPPVRNRIRFPYIVKTDKRVGLICPEDSPLMTEAPKLGVVAVGEESMFANIRAGIIPFNKLICHTDSEEALKKANLGKILGPKGLMPNKRLGTITNRIEETIRDLAGSDEYKEKDGVVRLAVGQLSFTPQMLADNLKMAMERIKKDMDVITDSGITKNLDEVVLSTTHGPGFSLNGKFVPTEDGVEVAQLESVM